jgi:cell division protein FtsB
MLPVSETPQRKAPARAPRVKKRSGRLLQFALIFITSVVLVDALIGEKGLLATIRARQEYDELADQIARTRAENVRLREAARELREEPAVIEELARRDLGLVRRGELLFIIKDVSPADARAAAPPAPPATQGNPGSAAAP